MRRINLTDRQIAALLFAACFLALLPSLFNGFIIDDGMMVTRNPHLDSWDGLLRIWTTTETLDYYPLTFTFFWFMKNLWGNTAFFYHLSNLILHACAAWMCFLMLRKLKVPHAAIVAAVFAIHPVQVETVAWVSELKNILSSFFFFAATYYFADSLEKEKVRPLLLCLGMFLLAILSKGTAVMLSPVLLLIYWWKKGNPLRAWKTLAPFFAISLAFGLLHTTVQAEHGAGQSDFVLSFGERVQIAGGAVWRYLACIVFPYPLSFNYPTWDLRPESLLHYLPALAVLVVAGVLIWKRQSWGGPAILGLGFFFLTIFPALGFLDYYTLRAGYYADHYQYLSMLGPVAFLAFLLGKISWPIPSPKLVPAALALALIPLGLISWEQATWYRNKETLWTRTLERNPKSWVAHNGLAGEAMKKGDPDAAEQHLLRAIELWPEYFRARDNLALVYAATGRTEEARKIWREILARHPDSREAGFHYAMQLVKDGEYRLALEHFDRALDGLYIKNPAAHYGIGQAHENLGDLDQAVEHYRKSLALNPKFVSSRIALGEIAVLRKDFTSAREHYEAALRFHPFDPDLHFKLGNLEAELGNYQAAIARARKARNLAGNRKLGELARKIELALEDFEKRERGEL